MIGHSISRSSRSYCEEAKVIENSCGYINLPPNACVDGLVALTRVQLLSENHQPRSRQLQPVVTWQSTTLTQSFEQARDRNKPC